MPSKHDLANYSNVLPSDGTCSIRINTQGSAGGSFTLKIGGQSTTHIHNTPNPYGSWLTWNGEIIEVSNDNNGGNTQYGLQRTNPFGSINGFYNQTSGKHYFYLSWIKEEPTPTYLETLDKLDQWSSAQYTPSRDILNL